MNKNVFIAAKALAAFVVSLAGALALVADDGITANEFISALAGTLAVSGVVYRVPNAKSLDPNTSTPDFQGAEKAEAIKDLTADEVLERTVERKGLTPEPIAEAVSRAPKSKSQARRASLSTNRTTTSNPAYDSAPYVAPIIASSSYTSSSDCGGSSSSFSDGGSSGGDCGGGSF